MNHIIYHDHCIDGFGSAYVVAKAMQQELKDYILHAFSYGQDIDSVIGDFLNSSDTVYIVDFSFSPECLVDLCRRVKKVVWLDHHKTAIDAWKEFTGGSHQMEPENLSWILDKGRSGVGITWDYFYADVDAVRPHWVNLIEDRDLWQWRYGDSSKQFHAGIVLVPRTIDAWDTALNDVDNIIDDGHVALAVQRKHVESICEDATDIIICGQKGLAANCTPAFASDVGHELCKRSGTFGATWHQGKGGDIKFSLRSEGAFDVAELAKEFGGGGHKNAAGFTLKDPTGTGGLMTVWSLDSQEGACHNVTAD